MGSKCSQADMWLLASLVHLLYSSRSWYRTCFDSDGECRATVDIQNISLDEYDINDDHTTVRTIFSPNWNTPNSSYVKSSISRYIHLSVHVLGYRTPTYSIIYLVYS